MLSIGLLGFIVWAHHMYTVGMDVDKLVFTEKILLYAGKSEINSPLVFNTFGTIYLLFGGLSAGNFSQSTHAKACIYTKHENLPKISDHVQNLPKNLSEKDLGYFMAGLIEADGWFGNKQLHIIFSEKDTPLAYSLKKRIGYGNVYKIKNKKAVRYICKHSIGLSYILSIINGKFVSNRKYDQLIKHDYSNTFNIKLLPPTYKFFFDNFWLAGFTQGDGCFHISVTKSKTHKTGYNVRLEYSIKQNDIIPLQLLYQYLNKGNLSQYKSGIWCYKSTGYSTAYDLINYFDKYPVFADKYKSYLKFRKVYIMITKGLHLDLKGVEKIKRISTKGSSETSTQEVKYF